MTDVNPDTTAAEEQATTATTATTATVEQASQELATGNTTEQATDKPETFDRDYVEKLRAENAKYRTKAKEVEDQFSSTKAEKDDLIQQIGKALGLVEDQTDDPAKLLEAATKREQELAQERDQTAQQLREYKQRDAIREASDTAKVTDPKLLEAVLRSDNAFNQLDINADDYGTQVAARIAQAIEAHPALAQVAPSASGVDTSTTNTGASKKLSQEDLTRLAAQGKWDEINEAAAAGRIA